MKTLALADGDLVVSPTGHATVTGTAKITTELDLALAEPYGDDRFHPSWGSYLPGYIGLPIDSTTQMLVEAEVNRVLQAYISVQRQGVVNDALNSARSRYATADVIASVNSITVTQQLDTLTVALSLTTVAGQTSTITRVVNL